MHFSWLLCYFTVVISLNLSHAFSFMRKSVRLCKSKHCQHIAQQFIKNMNPTVHPCEDFYEYACGRWSNNNPVPSYKLMWTQLEKDQLRIKRLIKELLLKHISDKDIQPVKLAKEMYRSCIDKDKISKANIDPLLSYLNESGGWPMAMKQDAWNSSYTWQQIDEHYFLDSGRSIFFQMAYEFDDKDPEKYVLAIKPNTHIPGYKHLIPNEMLKNTDKYSRGIRRIAHAFAERNGQELDKMQLVIDTVNMVLFEVDIINAYKNAKISSDKYSEKMTLGELQNWYNTSVSASKKAKIDFVNMFKHLFAKVNIVIDESEPIIVYNKEIFYKLMDHFDTISNRDIVNYVHWNKIFTLLSYTTQEMWNIKYDMVTTNKARTHQPRWLSCLTDMKMQDIISYMFIKKYFSENILEMGLKMFNNIRNEFKTLLDLSTGLSKEMTDSMRKKINHLHVDIGFPDWYKNDTNIIKEYEGLVMSDNFFENAIVAQRYELMKDVKQFREGDKGSSWETLPIVVNAFYIMEANKIVLPAAKFQYPSLSPYLPDGINYGALGNVIGHEISHSIDDSGVWSNENGTPLSWKLHEIVDYSKKSRCFLEQYRSYIFGLPQEDRHSTEDNTKLTLDEDIADNVGMHSSFRAYKKVLHSRKFEIRLPNLEHMSEDQLFFLSFANVWCSSIRPEYQLQTAKTEHSPPYIRVIGTISNMPEFSNAFHCPPNSPMNPSKKCILWY